MLSVILPTSNERHLDYLTRIIAALEPLDSALVERIAVDNASDDGTAELLQRAGWRLLSLPGSNRAQRLNAGITAASGQRVLLHHPRSLLAAKTVQRIAALPDTVFWGACTHRFDQNHPALRWTSFYSNRIRLDRRGIAYLDHCIFFSRQLLSAPVVPEHDIFEDTALSLRLRALAPPLRLPDIATTSAVRYRQRGVWSQLLLNQALKLGWSLRLPDRWMNRIYEGTGKGMNGARGDTAVDESQRTDPRRSG